MSSIRPVDFILIDELFGMEKGYVLKFSDREFAGFFATDLNLDIDDPEYRYDGTSKAKRLRYLLKTVDNETAARTLEGLWEYREAERQRYGHSDKVANAHGRLLALLGRLRSTTAGGAVAPPPAFDTYMFTELATALAALKNLEAHARGYSFETFLTKLFHTFGLKAREPFRNRGEQIDGSFVLNSDTYLLEAKWHNEKIGAERLHAFHGKVDGKAAWARGLFVSYSGFTEDGLHAFGRSKKVICMDGSDIFEALGRQLPLTHVLEQKVRRAAETGNPFVRVLDFAIDT